MNELKIYVDKLFKHQHLTKEIIDLKEEILTNMIAKKNDLLSQGFKENIASQKAKDSILTIDDLIEGNHLIYIDQYYKNCIQYILLNCVIFWILSLPLMLIHYSIISYIGFILTIISGIVYLNKSKSDVVTFVSYLKSNKVMKISWIIWSIYFLVHTFINFMIVFGSNIWYKKPINISGPYQFANIAIKFYIPVLTILIPITVFQCFKSLDNFRKEL